MAVVCFGRTPLHSSPTPAPLHALVSMPRFAMATLGCCTADPLFSLSPQLGTHDIRDAPTPYPGLRSANVFALPLRLDADYLQIAFRASHTPIRDSIVPRCALALHQSFNITLRSRQSSTRVRNPTSYPNVCAPLPRSSRNLFNQARRRRRRGCDRRTILSPARHHRSRKLWTCRTLSYWDLVALHGGTCWSTCGRRTSVFYCMC